MRTGAIWTRTGRAFFSDAAMTEALLAAPARGGRRRRTLGGTCRPTGSCSTPRSCPGPPRPSSLIESQYAPVAASSQPGCRAALDAAARGRARRAGREPARSLQPIALARAELYAKAWAPYVWPVTGVDDLHVAPFHLLASEGASISTRTTLAHGLCRRLAEPGCACCTRTHWRTVALDDEAARADAVAWWEDLTARGGEGMVVKPRDFIARGPKGLIQPALKVRGRGIPAHHLWPRI